MQKYIIPFNILASKKPTRIVTGDNQPTQGLDLYQYIIDICSSISGGSIKKLIFASTNSQDYNLISEGLPNSAIVDLIYVAGSLKDENIQNDYTYDTNTTDLHLNFNPGFDLAITIIYH